MPRFFEYWDPTATRVWLVFRNNANAFLMQEGLEPGCWELHCTEMPAGEPYAFLAEWVEEFRHCGRSSSFGTPHPDAIEVGLVAKDLPCLDADEKMSATENETARSAGYSQSECTDAQTDQETFDLGLNEFHLEAADNDCYAVTDGSGVRLSLLVAPRVNIIGAQVTSVDGGWGPLSLRKVQQAVSPRTLQCEEVVEAGPVPGKWLGDAVDFTIDGSSEFIVQVHRRDWRADAFAHALQRDTGDGWEGSLPGTEGAQDEVQIPLGPRFWSQKSPVMLQPAPVFQRCADRELVLYELHIGSFTRSGTLREATEKLSHIKDLGCTAISVMPLHQDARRLSSGEVDRWGYDVISFVAVDGHYGTLDDLLRFVEKAHTLGMAVFIDFVFNHMMWGATYLYGPQLFQQEETHWGPRPDFSKPEVQRYILAAAELLLQRIGVDGIRVDSTKSIRKFPTGEQDTWGAILLAELAALCRKEGKLAIAEDLEDGDGLLQWGGIGFHLQWDMALFCWIYDALVSPFDECRQVHMVVKGLVGLAPGRSHALRGRVVFMESHDTAACDRYGRVPAAVHNGRSFLPEGAEESGDAFQQVGGSMPYPDEEEVTQNPFAARRAALGLVLVMTAPGIPMLLQGQEVCESRPFQWPHGPRLDWSRVRHPSGDAAAWLQLSRHLIALRTGKGHRHTAELGPGSPLQGDGVHVFLEHGGILAYLRWSEAEDSRETRHCRARLALVVVNWRNQSFDSYTFGVPPSKNWSLALSVPESEDSARVDVQVNQIVAHGFPCSIDIPLQAYSAVILLQES